MRSSSRSAASSSVISPAATSSATCCISAAMRPGSYSRAPACSVSVSASHVTPRTGARGRVTRPVNRPMSLLRDEVVGRQRPDQPDLDAFGVVAGELVDGAFELGAAVGADEEGGVQDVLLAGGRLGDRGFGGGCGAVQQDAAVGVAEPFHGLGDELAEADAVVVDGVGGVGRDFAEPLGQFGDLGVGGHDLVQDGFLDVGGLQAQFDQAVDLVEDVAEAVGVAGQQFLLHGGAVGHGGAEPEGQDAGSGVDEAVGDALVGDQVGAFAQGAALGQVADDRGARAAVLDEGDGLVVQSVDVGGKGGAGAGHAVDVLGRRAVVAVVPGGGAARGLRRGHDSSSSF